MFSSVLCFARSAKHDLGYFSCFLRSFSANQVQNAAIAMKLGTIYGAHVSSRCWKDERNRFSRKKVMAEKPRENAFTLLLLLLLLLLPILRRLGG